MGGKVALSSASLWLERVGTSVWVSSVPVWMAAQLVYSTKDKYGIIQLWRFERWFRGGLGDTMEAAHFHFALY